MVGHRRDRRGHELALAGVEGTAVESSEFETVWRAANRTAHRQVVRILEDDGDRQVTDDGRVVVQLGPVYESIAEGLDQRGLVDASAVPPVEASVPLIRASDLDRRPAPGASPCDVAPVGYRSIYM